MCLCFQWLPRKQLLDSSKARADGRGWVEGNFEDEKDKSCVHTIRCVRKIFSESKSILSQMQGQLWLRR